MKKSSLEFLFNSFDFEVGTPDYTLFGDATELAYALEEADVLSEKQFNDIFEKSVSDIENIYLIKATKIQRIHKGYLSIYDDVQDVHYLFKVT